MGFVGSTYMEVEIKKNLVNAYGKKNQILPQICQGIIEVFLLS